MFLHRRRRLCVFGRFGAFGAHFCVFGRFGAFGADFCVILGVSAPPAPIFVCFRVFRRLRRRFVCVFSGVSPPIFVCVLGRFGAFGADFVCIVGHFGAFGADFICNPHWLIGRSVAWSVDRLVGRPLGRSAGRLVGWLAFWFGLIGGWVDGLVGWFGLVVWLFGWLVACLLA